MSSEVYSWPEGNAYLWTGTATASALVAFAENSQVSIAHGWENFRNLSGSYLNRHTAQRADFSVAALYTNDSTTLQALVDAKTAVHVHFKHSTTYGSAGLFLYSGRLTNTLYGGQAGGFYQWSVRGYANAWSAY